MKKLNKYQKLLLIFYGFIFVYFSVIHVPFIENNSNGITYDTLFSENANLDFNRLIIILFIISFAFALALILLNNFALKLNPKFKKKLKNRIVLYILISIVIIGGVIILFPKKQKNSTQIQTENTLPESIEINFSIDSTITGIEEIRKEIGKKLTNYTITNKKEFSNEKFEEYVSFTFHNTSNNVVRNIMFKGKFFPRKSKKDYLINKPVTLQANDTIKFVFEKDYYELFVFKIRFESGETITLNTGSNDYDNMIYTKIFDKMLTK